MVLALLALLVLAVGAWSLAQLRISLARGPMLIAPFGMAAAPDGTLLVGVDGSRVHVYSRDGSFLGAWPLPPDAAGGRFRIRLAGDERVMVATAATGRLLAFDRQGALVSDARDEEAFARFGSAGDLEARTPAGERYSIEDGALVRVAPAPEELLVPGLRWPLGLLVDRLPLVPLLLGAGSVGIFAGLALTARRRDAR